MTKLANMIYPVLFSRRIQADVPLKLPKVHYGAMLPMHQPIHTPADELLLDSCSEHVALRLLELVSIAAEVEPIEAPSCYHLHLVGQPS
jgi:hypothetical protein